MNELIEYDLYKSQYGVLYRVQLHSALHEPAELYLQVGGSVDSVTCHSWRCSSW